MKNLNTSEFLMIITDIFHITGQGTILTGKIDNGCISIGDIVCLLDSSYNMISENIIIKKLEIGFSRIRPTTADKGMNVGLLIKDTDITIKSGYILRAC